MANAELFEIRGQKNKFRKNHKVMQGQNFQPKYKGQVQMILIIIKKSKKKKKTKTKHSLIAIETRELLWN